MEPLSAVSLAGTIVQFVQYTGELLRSARAIHNSQSGLSGEGEYLEMVSTKLSDFCSALQSQKQEIPEEAYDTDQRASGHERTIKILAGACQTDCKRLLDIIAKVRMKCSSGPKWWKSLQAVLLEAVKADEIDAMKTRIERHQVQIIFYHCVTMRYSFHYSSSGKG